MFKIRTSKLFVLVIVVLVHFEGGSSISEVNAEVAKKPNSSRITYEAIGSRNLSGGQYLIEYSDYVEVSSFKNHQSPHFKYLDFPPGIYLENETNSRVVINKCCGLDYYFDVDNFTCAYFGTNQTEPYPFIDDKKNGEKELDILFIESVPGCGSESVVSVELTTKVSIGMSGITIDGKGVFPKYCVDMSPKYPRMVLVLTCHDPSSFCKARSCFRKCCPLGQSYEFPERKCRKSNEPFKPDFYNLSTLTIVDSARLSQYGIYLGDACGTKGKYLLERELEEVSYLGIDGTLFAPSFENKYFSENEFCVEFVKTKNFSRMESFLCFSKTGTYFENSQLQFFLLSLGFIISCLFLLLTFLVYLFSPKNQNTYGKTLMCYIACLFTAYLCLAVVELRSKEFDKIVCRNLGYSLLFSFLAAFFWLNVISYDIWKTFRLERTVERSKPNRGKLRFFWYSVYAWGFPSVLTGVCAYANQVQSFPFEIIKPDIGEDHCWFSKKKKGIYVFFIAPISLVIAFNIIFYVQTAWKIWKVKSDVNKIERQKPNKFASNKEHFIINGKLFIVMGITWSLDIVSYFAPHPIWYLTDAANALHGVFIFAVFVLKKKVFQQFSQQVRAPLYRMRQLTSFNTDELSTRKNFQDLNTEGKISAIRLSPLPKRIIKN